MRKIITGLIILLIIITIIGAIIFIMQPQNKDVGKATLAGNVKIIDEDTSAKFYNNIQKTSLDDHRNIIIEFNSEFDISQFIKDEIFLIRPTSKEKEGFAARVKNISITDEKKVLTIEQPLIEEVFDKIDVNIQRKISKRDIISSDLIEDSPISSYVINNSDRELLVLNQGLNLSEILKSFSIEQKQNLQNSIKTGVPVFDEISFKFKDALIYDKDGVKETKGDQIILDGKIALKDASVETVLKYDKSKPYKWEQCMARIISTPTLDTQIKYNVDNLKIGLNNIIPKEKNSKIDLKFLTIEGIKSEENKLALGFVNFDLGTCTISSGLGENIKSSLGATIIFTMTANGTISAAIQFKMNYGCFLDKGFNITNIKGEFNTETYDVFADASYPNSNVTKKPPTETHKNSKPSVEWGIDGTGKLEYGYLYGIDAAVSILGVIPAKITNDFGIEGKIEASGAFNNKGLKGTIVGSMKDLIKGNFVARIAIENAVGWKNLDYKYSMQLYEIPFWKKEFKVNSEQIRCFGMAVASLDLQYGIIMLEDKEYEDKVADELNKGNINIKKFESIAKNKNLGTLGYFLLPKEEIKQGHDIKNRTYNVFVDGGNYSCEIFDFVEVIELESNIFKDRKTKIIPKKSFEHLR